MGIILKRTRYIVMRDDDAIFCGLAQNYKFKLVKEIGDTAIKTYLSENKAKASFLSSWWDSKKEDFESGIYRVVKVNEVLEEVTPQEPQSFKWCETCKEYDQEKHCCHRWSKVIRDTVKEMKQEQESILDKIRVEIEQRPYGIANDSVIQGMKYERADILKILDKHKAESEVEDGNDD